MGFYLDYYYIYICNSFQAKIVNDQLCYEVDLNKYSNKDNIESELSTVFIFMMDYNEDRQVTFDKDKERSVWEYGLASKNLQKDNNKHAAIYLNTIGMQLVTQNSS